MEFWTLFIPGRTTIWWLKKPQGFWATVGWKPTEHAHLPGPVRGKSAHVFQVWGRPATSRDHGAPCKSHSPVPLASLPERGKNTAEGKSPEVICTQLKGPEAQSLPEDRTSLKRKWQLPFQAYVMLPSKGIRITVNKDASQDYKLQTFPLLLPIWYQNQVGSENHLHT